ncbi:hypothetical protein CRUP_031647, partial [Coryphaenoides rupestris]
MKGTQLTSTSWSSQRDRLRDLTFPMSGMLRWTPEQSRQMKTPREQDPHSGKREALCGRVLTGSLKDRHIENKDLLYAIFTPMQNLQNNILIRNPAVKETPGEHTVRCHIMLKGNFDISVNLTTDTIKDLRRKLAKESGIPAHA